MGPHGYSEFHRDSLSEIDREGLVVDVRFNGGGHVSELILEKLARRRIAYNQSRWSNIQPYPVDSVAGPMVAITNEYAGSDGDIFSHGFKLLKLGPLIGKRTWGGVIGIWPRNLSMDGSFTTQPEVFVLVQGCRLDASLISRAFGPEITSWSFCSRFVPISVQVVKTRINKGLLERMEGYCQQNSQHGGGRIYQK